MRRKRGVISTLTNGDICKKKKNPANKKKHICPTGKIDETGE